MLPLHQQTKYNKGNSVLVLHQVVRHLQVLADQSAPVIANLLVTANQITAVHGCLHR
jgi:hypothetical protein